MRPSSLNIHFGFGVFYGFFPMGLRFTVVSLKVALTDWKTIIYDISMTPTISPLAFLPSPG
jgi:hypothetical protein